MKRLYGSIIIIFTFYTSLFSTDFYKSYYVDKFGDKTNEWYLYSESILGTSPNSIGGKTEFSATLCIDDKDVFFDIKRSNGDAYSGEGFIYIKLENGEIKTFSAKNFSGCFFPSSEYAEELRNLILNETKIKVVVETQKMPYSFNLGTIDLTILHNLLEDDKK